MKDSNTIYIDGIGPITLEHGPRVKKTTLTVNPNEGVMVVVSNGVSFEAAMEFVNRNEHWIRNALAKIDQQKTEN